MTKRKDIFRINLIVPRSWEELSQEQLKYYFFVLTMCQSAAEVKTYCLCRWSGLEVLYPYGTGRETPRGNSGDLGRAKKRQRRRWFSRKYYASVMRLKEFYEENIGREFCGIVFNTLDKKATRK